MRWMKPLTPGWPSEANRVVLSSANARAVTLPTRELLKFFTSRQVLASQILRQRKPPVASHLPSGLQATL